MGAALLRAAAARAVLRAVGLQEKRLSLALDPSPRSTATGAVLGHMGAALLCAAAARACAPCRLPGQVRPHEL